MGISFCIGTHVCTIAKVTGINKEKEIYLLKKITKVVIDEEEYGCQMHIKYAYYC